MNDLQQKLRAVTDEDRQVLKTVSYSKLDTVANCRRKYKLRYVDKMFSNDCNISLDMGSIVHKALELKGNYILDDEKVDYEHIKDVLYNGSHKETEKDKESMIGFNEMQKIYLEDWGNYIEKINLFLNTVLPSRINDNGWKVIGCEIPFEFVYDNQCIIHGFIDRVDEKEIEGERVLRITDYKTSKKVFLDSKIKTPLQMVIYDLACLYLYGTVPLYHEYDFVLLDQKQTTETGVCTKGYLKRGLKKLDGLLKQINVMEETQEYAPSPTPLCYWCPYSSKVYTPFADKQYGNNCDYYSLWTPDNKVFQTNKPYVPGEPEQEKRKLVF